MAGRGRARLATSTLGVFVVLAALASVIRWDFVLQLDFAALTPYRIAFLRGLSMTLAITLISVTAGLALGTVLAALGVAPNRVVRGIVRVWLEIWRDLPLVVVLFWVHFALPLLTGISTSAPVSGTLAISLQASAYLADVVGAGIQSVAQGQWEAAASLGLPRRAIWAKIVLPQAFATMLPSIVNIMLGFFKASAILALLPAGEFMSVSSDIASRSFRPIETFIVTGVVYLLLGWALGAAAALLERRLARARA